MRAGKLSIGCSVILISAAVKLLQRHRAAIVAAESRHGSRMLMPRARQSRGLCQCVASYALDLTRNVLQKRDCAGRITAQNTGWCREVVRMNRWQGKPRKGCVAGKLPLSDLARSIFTP